jgi:hypothetical protein
MMQNARDRRLPDKVGTEEIAIIIIMMVIDTTIMIGVDPNGTKKETLKLKNKVELTVVEVAKTVTEEA